MKILPPGNAQTGQESILLMIFYPEYQDLIDISQLLNFVLSFY